MKKLLPEERSSTFPGRLLHDGRHYRVEILPGAKTVLLVRSPYPFVSPDDVDAGCTPVQLILDKLGRSRYNVLVDTRHATANNDPVYESWFEAHRKRMVQGFRRAAIVIRTAVGGLQTRRLVQHDASPVVLFTSMDDAIAYLEADGSVPPTAGGRMSSAPPVSGSRRIKE